MAQTNTTKTHDRTYEILGVILDALREGMQASTT